MFCQNCSKRNTCKKICKELEETLSHDQDGRLKGEFSIPNEVIETAFILEKNDSITHINKPKNIIDY